MMYLVNFNFSSYNLFVLLEVVVVVCELVYLLYTCLNILNGRSIDITDEYDESDNEDEIIQEYFQNVEDEVDLNQSERLILSPQLLQDGEITNNNDKEELYKIPKDFILQNFLNHMKEYNCCSICLDNNADNISLCCGSMNIYPLIF